MSERAKVPQAIVSTSTESLARGLGWFSVGLGAAELLAPRTISRLFGLPGRSGMVAGGGLRSIATGAGILLSDRRRGWLWGRVAGDALDALSLVRGLHRRNRHKGNVSLGLFAIAGVMALDVFCARALDAEENQVLPGPRAGDQGPMPYVPASPRAGRRVAVSSGT